MEATHIGDMPFLEGRYRAQRLLKRSHGVDTWLASDESAGGRRVVVKAVAAAGVSAATRARLEHEAQVLGRLETPSFRPLLAWGRHGDAVFLVQPFVRGVTLEQRLTTGPMSPASSLRTGIDVLSHLALAHDHGVLHRDVKPANIMVDGDDPVRRAVLVDFGLAKSAGLDPSVRDEPVGTARYLAPEASGLLDVGADERADLYSFGVVLFECLAGRPPFEGKVVGEVLRQHLTSPAPRLRSLGVAVPRALDEVVARLLRKDPDERYQSAAAALADLEQIAAALDRGEIDPQVTIGLHDRRIALTEAGFVGRADELTTLARLLGQAGRGRGGLVLVEAESGGGKSRLLDELTVDVGPEAWTLRGQGVDQAAQRPFQLLDGVAATILAAAEADPAAIDRLGRRLDDRTEAVVAALPVLGAALGEIDRDRLGPEAYGEVRSIEALSALFDSLGEPGRPALVLLDDCQWADGLTARLLARWSERSDRGPCHALVVAAFRSEEAGPDHALRALRSRATISLGPFDPADVALLCASMAGMLPAEAIDAVVHLADGSPFMASAILRGMVESGALAWIDPEASAGGDTPPGAGGWQVDPGPMAAVQTSRRAALFLVRRLELLSPEVLELLSVGAVLGKEFDLGLASELSGRSLTEATGLLQEARRRRILWVDEASGRCSFCHDKLREALLTRLSGDERGDLHRRAAQRLEETSPDRIFELAYHYDAGGDAGRALDYALRAARAARPQHALEVAAAHYRVAERWAAAPGSGAADTAIDGVRARIAEELGDVLVLQGQYREAASRLEAALVLTSDRVARVNLEAKLGDLAFKRGDPVSARTWLEGALRHLGRWAPRRSPAFLVGLLWEALVQAGHSLVPWLRHRHRPHHRPGRSEEDFLAIRIYSRLAYVNWFHSGKVTCGWAHLREMNLAERYPPSLALAQAYSEHAPVATMLPWFGRGIAYSKRSLAIRRELGDLWGQGQSLHFYGVVLYAASRYRECIDTCREAIRLLQRTGDRWEEHTAAWHLAYSHYRLGDLDKAVEVARHLYESATAIGDSAAAGISLSVWSKASGGRVPADLVAAELARGNDDAHTSTEVHVAEAVRLLAGGSVDDAVVVLEAAVGIIRHAGLRQEYVVPVYPWLATARRRQAEAVPPVAVGDRHRAVVQASKAAARAYRLARRYRNNLPHALREQALVAALDGKPARARRLLARSLTVAEEQGARYEQALTVEARARLGASLGWAQAPDAVTDAEASVALLLPHGDEGTGRVRAGEPASLDLTDRFASLLEVSRTIAAAASEEAIWDAVRHAALTLLRGERCHLVAIGDAGPESDTMSGEGVGEVSTNLIARAIAANAPVVSGESGSGDVTESMVLSGVRSSLCAPICSEGRIVACFTVTHRQVGGLFGDEEVQLAEFVATLAGAALDHVAGSEARYRSLALNSTDVVTIVDASGAISYQTSSVSRVFGFEAAELLGQSLSSWLHPDDAVTVNSLLDGVARSPDGSTLVQCRLRHRDRSWRHVEIAVRNLIDDPGVRGLVLNTRDVSERVALETELRKQAWHDGLTGLANRALFTDRVNQAIARQSRVGSPLSVLFLDLDDFKSLNDTMGHAAGDVVLLDVARRLEGCIRPGDTVARFGGDEFAVLLENAGQPDGERVASRVLSQLAGPFEVLGRQVQVRASVGVAVAVAEEGAPVSVDDLLANADAAMYVAETLGKDRFQVFETRMRTAAVERSGLRTDLGWAVERDELDVHYQPIIAIATGTVTGFEALVRWHHPRLGLLLPGAFIDMAEESGLIVPIGAWVLGRACRQARAWGDAHAGERFTMAVNVSARQLHDPGLVATVAGALADSGIDPATLVLEITESVTVADTDATMARLRALKDLGVSLAIDDFGTGYSSLQYLRRFPVDLLKIDRSFVTGLGHNTEDSAIVSSVIGLAHAFGLGVVAEGVETVEQLEALTLLGCDYAQGYNWARPAPSHEAAQWLTAVLADRATPPGLLRVVIADDRAPVRAATRLAMEVHCEKLEQRLRRLAAGQIGRAGPPGRVENTARAVRLGTGEPPSVPGTAGRRDDGSASAGPGRADATHVNARTLRASPDLGAQPWAAGRQKTS
ncbi:MAG TPA: EAL domain-containing protein [Acidimicrobiales bacterium]|nr:EAL domain-containing protein [Acidimicrobiales bacterium]